MSAIDLRSIKKIGMGKRAHGRLLHEIRATLIGRGFSPKRVTVLASRPGEKPDQILSAGFSLAKYHDSKSIALSHWLNNKGFWQGFGQAGEGRRSAVKRDGLHKYHEALLSAGFVSIACHCEDSAEPFSLWRREPLAESETLPAGNCDLKEYLEVRGASLDLTPV